MKRLKMDVQKKALMIAPSYIKLPEKDWLTANEIDAQDMKNTMIQKCDFHDDNIKVLQGEQATKENILTELGELVMTCEPRSVVLLYYAGHGLYLPDSQDEGLLPTVLEWPAKKPLEEICITGQDLCHFFEEFSKKSVYCTVIFDCCYSGYLYRVVNELESKLEGMKIRQFVPESTTSGHKSTTSGPKKYTKADRGGWLPKNKDFFFYFGACSSVQKAHELMNKGGLLTLAIVDTLNKLHSPDKVNYEAFFRLLKKEFKFLKKKIPDKVDQTPQFEGVNSNTALFGNVSVQQSDGGIEISDVDNDKVFLNSGFLQNLRAGKYFVYETTASEDSVSLKKKSPDYLGIIDVNEGQIDVAQAIGSVYSLRYPDCRITSGCLAYLETPETINHSVYVCPGPNSVDDKTLESLIKDLKETCMLNVFTEADQRLEANPDLITITCETIKSKTCWVARENGKIHVPPISVGNESFMAANLCRYIRYYEVLDRAQSPKDDNFQLLKDVTFKAVRTEHLNYVFRTKESVLAEKLKNGIDITEAYDREIIFKPHKMKADGMKLIPGSGDSLIWQVTNGKKTREDSVHICVIMFQCDGAIDVLYPKKSSTTVELPGNGDTIEGVVNTVVFEGGLRRMAEPDLTKDEPKEIMDTLVLYASSEPVDYQPLLQTAIQTDSQLLSKSPRTDSKPLSSLEKFLKCLKSTSPKDGRTLVDGDDTGDLKYMIKKLKIYTKSYESP